LVKKKTWGPPTHRRPGRRGAVKVSIRTPPAWCLCLYEAAAAAPANPRPSPLSNSAPPDHRDRAGGCEGRLPLSQQRRPRPVRSGRAPASTTACCSTCWATWPTGNSNVFMVKDGVVDDPGAQRHVPRWHHAPAHHPAIWRDAGETVLETPAALMPTSSRPTRSSPPATSPSCRRSPRIRSAGTAARPNLPQGQRTLPGVRGSEQALAKRADCQRRSFARTLRPNRSLACAALPLSAVLLGRPCFRSPALPAGRHLASARLLFAERRA